MLVYNLGRSTTSNKNRPHGAVNSINKENQKGLETKKEQCENKELKDLLSNSTNTHP